MLGYFTICPLFRLNLTHIGREYTCSLATMGKATANPSVAKLMEEVRLLKAENARLAELVASYREEGDHTPSAPPAEEGDAVTPARGVVQSRSGQQTDSVQTPPVEQVEAVTPVRGLVEEAVARARARASVVQSQASGEPQPAMKGKWIEKDGWRIWRRDPVGSTGDEDWQVVRGRKAARHRQAGGCSPVRTSNRFSALQDNDEQPGKGSGLVVVGDSRVRHLGRAFCQGRKGRKCFTKPGARVKDLTAVAAQLTVEEEPSVMIVQVGVNDIGKTHSEELLNNYRDLLRAMKDGRRQVIVTGILPRRGVSDEWSSRALGVNGRVGKLCQELGMTFVDEWDRFYGSWFLYQRDGLHFSEKGVQLMSSIYENVLQGN